MRIDSWFQQNNIKPGTVVDTGIVHPKYSEFLLLDTSNAVGLDEFYLNSHSAIQGSAKTPRYTALIDESDFDMDALEMMTYVRFSA